MSADVVALQEVTARTEPLWRAALAEAGLQARETALDLEDVRAALRVEKLTLYGVSYGATVAGEYARRFPARTASIVLDSPDRVNGSDVANVLRQLGLPRILREICFPPSCRDFLAEPTVALATLVRRLQRRPLRGRAAAVELKEQLDSLFALRHCGRALHRRRHPAVYGQMGRCLSPCLGDLDPNLYRRRLDEALALAADVVKNPRFAPAEVERQRARRLTALEQQKDVPAALLGFAVASALYPDDHPYARTLLGTAEALRAATPGSLRAFYDVNFRPDRVTVAVAGDVTPDEAKAALEKALGDWKGKGG
ncbi:MAG: alpha/beta fold hydrolase, partial [Proteobacteria bacterium]|nr:alpha/beta fold hydrolase [Pseudomonadota bacterium]